MRSGAEAAVPAGYLELPESMNIADRIVSRWIREGRGDRPAMHCGAATWTYAELEERLNRAGNALRSLGVGKGDFFLIRSPNTLDYVAVVLGGMKIGAVPIPSNTLFRSWELEHTIVNSDSRLVLVAEDARGPVDEVRNACPQLRHVLGLETEFAGMMDTASSELAAAETHRDDPAYAIYTSGTTGSSKGVVHAHRTIVAAGDPVCHVQLGLTGRDSMIVPIELSSLITLDFSVFWPLHVGGCGALFVGRFDPERFLADVERLRLTLLMGVPTMFRFLLSVPEAERRFDLSSVRAALVGGEPLSEELYGAVKERYGWELYEMIGSTEAHPYVANRVGETPKVGSLGLPLSGRTAVVLDEQGNEVPPDTIGHLCLRADDPAIALGYRKLEDVWAAMFAHGWFYTGDLARCDEDGWLWFVSRADDLIMSRAYRISPSEVEDACLQHPAVAEAAVVGVADEQIGQRVKAYLVLTDGRQASASLVEEIRDRVRSLIAPYKCPKEIEFVEVLPRTMSGKIQRKALREQAAAAGVKGGATP